MLTKSTVGNFERRGDLYRCVADCGRLLPREAFPAFAEPSHRTSGVICAACTDSRVRYSSALHLWKEQTRGDQKEARRQLDAALQAGAIVRATTCERDGCGSTSDIEAHHANYARALDVTWLCRQCHQEEHRRLRSLLIEPLRSVPAPIFLPTLSSVTQ